MWVLIVGAMCVTPPMSSAGASRVERASKLLASAHRRIALGTHEQRQLAITELQDAALIDPARSEIVLTLGQVYLDGDYLRSARLLADRLLVKDSTSAGVWLFAGQVRRRYWLTELDDVSRNLAIRCFLRSARQSPRSATALLLLVPLLVEAGEMDAANDATELAARIAPRDVEVQLLLASLAQRRGELEAAARLFQAAIPGLAPARRERYEDITALLPPPVADRCASMDTTARAKFTQQFWVAMDPNPVSIENEARLEYWARVTQAIALYGTSRPGYWDMRAQYYARFGPPEMQRFDAFGPNGEILQESRMRWIYPWLGMQLSMATTGALSGYIVPLTLNKGWARAAPESLATHPGCVAVYGGYAIFHRLPEGATPIDARLVLAQFQAQQGVSVLAQAETAGGPGSEYTVEWVVLDSAYAEVAREHHMMSASACRAGEARAASFTSMLAPGRYRIGVECSDAHGHRAVLGRDFYVPPPPVELTLSDLVITCSAPAQSVVTGSGVRLEPQTGLFPAAGDKLNVYLEIYRLAQSKRGEAAFTYDCVVRRVVADKRGWWSKLFTPLDSSPLARMSRTETTRGALRRQFLTIPVTSLPSGAYEVEMSVRDETNGAETKAVAQFTRQ